MGHGPRKEEGRKSLSMGSETKGMKKEETKKGGFFFLCSFCS
jgi:hypothetical protein